MPTPTSAQVYSAARSIARDGPASLSKKQAREAVAARLKRPQSEFTGEGKFRSPFVRAPLNNSIKPARASLPPPPQQTPRLSSPGYSAMSVAALKAVAKERGIKAISRKTKPAIIAALRQGVPTSTARLPTRLPARHEKNAYNRMTLPQLRAAAAARKLTGISRLRKAELANKVRRAHGVGGVPSPARSPVVSARKTATPQPLPAKSSTPTGSPARHEKNAYNRMTRPPTRSPARHEKNAYNRMTLSQLRAAAASKKLTGVSRLRKAELANKVRRAHGGAPPMSSTDAVFGFHAIRHLLPRSRSARQPAGLGGALPPRRPSATRALRGRVAAALHLARGVPAALKQNKYHSLPLADLKKLATNRDVPIKRGYKAVNLAAALHRDDTEWVVEHTAQDNADLREALRQMKNIKILQPVPGYAEQMEAAHKEDWYKKLMQASKKSASASPISASASPRLASPAVASGFRLHPTGGFRAGWWKRVPGKFVGARQAPAMKRQGQARGTAAAFDPDNWSKNEEYVYSASPVKTKTPSPVKTKTPLPVKKMNPSPSVMPSFLLRPASPPRRQTPPPQEVPKMRVSLTYSPPKPRLPSPPPAKVSRKQANPTRRIAPIPVQIPPTATAPNLQAFLAGLQQRLEKR